MLVGHTKFAPDLFFGLIKRKYHRTPSYSINDMVKVIQSSTVAGGNTVQLTKDVNAMAKASYVEKLEVILDLCF